MASDITLAVGDGSRRMTYAELADMRRISVASAERLVRRRRWERISGNDGVVRISVPLAEARKKPARTKPVSVSGQEVCPPDNNGVRDVVRTLETAVSVLSAQLDRERDRADRAEAQLGDATAAERIARDEAAGLRAEADRRREWGLRRRLRWALSGR